MFQIKLLKRSPGYYLFYTGSIYLSVGLYSILVKQIATIEVIQAVWVTVMALPFIIPPFGRWINLDVTWDLKLINWVKNRNKSEITFYFTEEEIQTYMQIADKQNITFDKLIEIALKEIIIEYKRDPEGFRSQYNIKKEDK